MGCQEVEESLLRKLSLGFGAMRVLHMAQLSQVFGLQLMDQLAERGFEVSAGTLYPLLHQMEVSGLLSMHTETVDGKVRKYYRTTARGAEVLAEAKRQVTELLADLKDV
jgi:DNA-binding PadR family transcriptional regulator